MMSHFYADAPNFNYDSLINVRPKKDVCLPFSDRPKILENKCQLFFFFVLFCFVCF